MNRVQWPELPWKLSLQKSQGQDEEETLLCSRLQEDGERLPGHQEEGSWGQAGPWKPRAYVSPVSTFSHEEL